MAVHPSTKPISPDVYFPIEISSREYAGHLLLAVRLSSDGVNSVIGHREPVGALIQSARRPGIVYFKGDGSRTFGRPDFLFVGQDPETGLIYRKYEDFFKVRPQSLGQLATSAAYFCFGEKDHNFLQKKFPQIAERVHRTGSPRTMLWGDCGASFYRSRIEQVSNRYGDFILLASSGASGNPYILRKTESKKHNDQQQKMLANYVRDNERKRERLLNLGMRLSRETKLNVVVRPHPAESWSFWQQATAHLDNVFVDSAFDLNVWVRAAKFVLQSSGSTTAFEAWCSNTPVLSDSASDRFLQQSGGESRLITRDISISFASEDKLLEALPAIPDIWATLRQSESKKLVASRLDSPPSDATVSISSAIRDLLSSGAPTGIRRLHSDDVQRRVLRTLKREKKHKEHLGRKSSPPFKRWAMSRDAVEADVAMAATILSVPVPRVREVLPNAFQVEAVAEW